MQAPRKFSGSFSRRVFSQYLLFLPQAYSSTSKKRWPLILFLHGAGERGTNIDKVTQHGPPKIAKLQPDFPFIVLSPQCPADSIWDNDTILALLEYVIEHHPVDPRRVYLTGISMGGYASWSLALRHPHRFAAVAPVCGGGNAIDVLLASRRNSAALKRLPFWVFHGARDSVVDVTESDRMVSALQRAGVRSVRLTIYPEAEHDCWTETYLNPALYEWFLAQKARG